MAKTGIFLTTFDVEISAQSMEADFALECPAALYLGHKTIFENPVEELQSTSGDPKFKTVKISA